LLHEIMNQLWPSCAAEIARSYNVELGDIASYDAHHQTLLEHILERVRTDTTITATPPSTATAANSTVIYKCTSFTNAQPRVGINLYTAVNLGVVSEHNKLLFHALLSDLAVIPSNLEGELFKHYN